MRSIVIARNDGMDYGFCEASRPTTRDKMERKRRDYPWRRNRRRLLLIVFAFFGTVALALAVVNWRGESSLEKQIAAIRAKGEPITPNELAQRFPAPPRENNAADTYGKAGEALKPALDDNHYRAKITKISEAQPQDRFAEELHKWMEGYLADHADALSILHEAARNPATRYDFDLGKGFEAPIPNLLQLRGSAQLLQMEAYVAAEDGDRARAADAVAAALAMDRPMREAPTLIMQMMRLALRSMACITLKRVLPMVAFSDEQLAQLQAAVAETWDPEALTNAFIFERASGLSAFERPQLFLPQIQQADNWFPGAASLAAGVVRFSMTASGDRERYLKYMTDMIDASRRPVPEALDIMENMGKELSSRRSFIPGFAEMVIPNLMRCETQAARGDAFLFGARAALALERYRLANGRPPAQIAELVPVFLPSLPLDPFDGQPLRYVADDRGYTFYSVGENRKDDGGQDTPGKNLDVAFRVTYPSKQE